MNSYHRRQMASGIKQGELEYRDLLIKNGLDPELATAIAAKTEPSSRKRATHAAKTLSAQKKKTDATPIAPDTPDLFGSTSPSAPAPQALMETVDFRRTKGVPRWINEVISAHLAIEAEDARKADALGFMARALVIATMPYKDQKNPDGSPKESFTRQNGDFKLRIVAGYEGGIPYGIYPRLLMSWVTTEAVRKQSPIIELGDSLRGFLRDVMDLRSSGGGSRGTSTRVSEQMRRLFGSLITAQYSGSHEKRGFVLKNVLIADELELHEDDDSSALWTPQAGHEAGSWRSKVKLTENFFRECITNPVPIDLRAYKALRGSPLAMDVYTWLTYRLSYVHAQTRPISWETLMLQFGSGYGAAVSSEQGVKQAVLDFKRAFLKALKLVAVVYPEAKIEVTDRGILLLPSQTHIQAMRPTRQQELF